MDREALAKQLKQDEGVRLTAYHDSLGFLSCGVGHLCIPEDHMVIGQTITAAQCHAFLEADITTALHACLLLWPAFLAYPEEAQQVLANMAFNLGMTHLRGFHALIKAVSARDWYGAAAAGCDSRWAEQVGKRAERLMVRLGAVTET